ncbi:unnamed protein product, partial [Mesorhabditis spiculigera]
MLLSTLLRTRASPILRMPVLRVVTNLGDVPETLEAQLTKVVADIMKKPEERFWCEVQTGARISQGGTKDPCVFVSVKSIGAVGKDETPRLSQQITDYCHNALSVAKDKISVQYIDMDPNTFARGGTTIAEQLAQQSKQ